MPSWRSPDISPCERIALLKRLCVPAIHPNTLLPTISPTTPKKVLEGIKTMFSKVVWVLRLFGATGRCIADESSTHPQDVRAEHRRVGTRSCSQRVVCAAAERHQHD